MLLAQIQSKTIRQYRASSSLNSVCITVGKWYRLYCTFYVNMTLTPKTSPCQNIECGELTITAAVCFLWAQM